MCECKYYEGRCDELRDDKAALVEMLKRTREYISAIDGLAFPDDDAMLGRIDSLLRRMKG